MRILCWNTFLRVLHLGLAALLTLAIAGGCNWSDFAQNAPENQGGDAAQHKDFEKSAPIEGSAIRFHYDYRKARQAAREENKPLMLFFSSPNCVYSGRMLSDTFSDNEVKRLAERFICVQIDSSGMPELCKEFGIKGFPTIQFMSPHGVLLKRVAGKQSPDQLVSQMDAAIQSIVAKPGGLVKR